MLSANVVTGLTGLTALDIWLASKHAKGVDSACSSVLAATDSEQFRLRSKHFRWVARRSRLLVVTYFVIIVLLCIVGGAEAEWRLVRPQDAAADFWILVALCVFSMVVVEETLRYIRTRERTLRTRDPYSISEELSTYLRDLAEALASLPAYYPKGFGFDEIRQRVRVSTRRLVWDEQVARAQEAARRSGLLLDEGDDETASALYDRRGVEMYEQAGPTVIAWDEERSRIHRAVILGDPGFGKSWLLRYEGRRTCQEQIAVLDRNAPEELITPVHARLTDLGRALGANSGHSSLVHALIDVVRSGFPRLSADFLAWLTMRIDQGRCLLLLDGLDEVAPSNRERLVLSLQALADQTDCRILVTSRIVGYHQPPFSLSRDNELEVELVTWTRQEVAGFISAWFPATDPRSQELEPLLHRNPALRGLARIPLLLSFLCLVADRPEPLPRRRTELYHVTLHRLLEGSWREENLRDYDLERRYAKLTILEKVAFHFSTGANGWRDLLPERELSDLISNARQLEPALSHGSSILTELSEVNSVLVKAGESRGQADSSVPYLFLHRTLQEFLLASYLSRQESAIWHRYVLEHCWFDPDWQEPITLLTGSLEDPNGLLRALLDSPYDAFAEMTLLAARCLSETSEESVGSELEEELLRRLTVLSLSASLVDKARAVHVLAEVGPRAYRTILNVVSNEAIPNNLRTTATEALGRFGDYRAVDGLIGILSDVSIAVEIRESVAASLGQIGDGRAVPALTAVLTDSQNRARLRRFAASAIGRISDEAAVKVLLDNTTEHDRAVNAAISYALSQVPGDSIVEHLEALVSNQSADLASRRCATRALGSRGDTRAALVLEAVAVDKDEDDELRRVAIGAIEYLHAERAVKTLIALVRDRNESPQTRKAAIKALGEIGGRLAIDELVAALRDPSFPVQQAAGDGLVQLGQRGDTSAVPGLSAILLDRAEGPKIRQNAAWILGFTGDPQAASVLREVVVSDISVVRTSVAKALARLGDQLAIPNLIDVLGDETAGSGLRKAAIGAIGQLRGSIAVDALIALVQDQGPDRQVAVEALGLIGDPEAAPVLGRQAADKGLELDLRTTAAKALGALEDWNGSSDVLKVLFDTSEPVRLRRAVATALGASGDHGVAPSLVAVLRDGTAGVQFRKDAVYALERLGGSVAVDGLVGVLTSRGFAVRQVAIQALSRLGDQRAASPLLDLVRDRSVDIRLRRTAVRALEQIAPPWLVDELLALVSKDPSTRAFILPALARLTGTADPVAVTNAALLAWIEEVGTRDPLVAHYDLMLAFAPYLARAVEESSWPQWRRRFMPPLRRVLRVSWVRSFSWP